MNRGAACASGEPTSAAVSAGAAGACALEARGPRPTTSTRQKPILPTLAISSSDRANSPCSIRPLTRIRGTFARTGVPTLASVSTISPGSVARNTSLARPAIDSSTSRCLSASLISAWRSSAALFAARMLSRICW